MKFLKSSFQRRKSVSSGMGCGASTSNTGQKAANAKTLSDNSTNPSHTSSEQRIKQPLTSSTIVPEKSEIDANANIPHSSGIIYQQNESKEKEKLFPSVPKPVAFDINLDEPKSECSIIKKYPPKRLTRLEAPPELKESEQLIARLKSAEERKQEIVKRLESAGKSRDRQKAVIVAKQQLREERAKRARLKAQKLNEFEPEEINFDVEIDPVFNSYDDEEDWLETNPEEISKWPSYEKARDHKMNLPMETKPPHHLRRHLINQNESITDDRDEFFDV